MTLQIQHRGLYFSTAQIQAAKEQRADNPALQMAWQWLQAVPGDLLREEKPKQAGDAPLQIHKPQLRGLAATMEAAFRFCFDGDEAAGLQAVEALYADRGLYDAQTRLETLMHILASAQIYEMLHQHSDFGRIRAAWHDSFADFSGSLLNTENPTPLEALWLLTLRIVRGIVLEDEAGFNTGVADFRRAVDTQIHPEGYLRFATDEQDGPTFERHVLGAAALSLAAEAATHAGTALWTYENRDVGVNTAATYLVYYYFYPDKWRWSDHLDEDETARIFRLYGAFIEMVTYHANPRGVELLLELQRPFFSVACGGFTTLSHGTTQKRKKRRWFS